MFAIALSMRTACLLLYTFLSEKSLFSIILTIFTNSKIKRGIEMKTRTEILHLLSLYKPTAESRYGLTRLGVFGSVARDEQTEDSDVDVCYEGRVPSLLTLDLIQTDLEQLLGSRVDLVRVRDGMNSLLRERIQKECVYV